MSENFDYGIKLGSVFTALEGIDLPIEEFDFPVAIGNALIRGGIHNLQQLLAMSGDELLSTIFRWGDEQRRRRMAECVIDKLERFNTNIAVPFGKDGFRTRL